MKRRVSVPAAPFQQRQGLPVALCTLLTGLLLFGCSYEDGPRPAPGVSRFGAAQLIRLGLARRPYVSMASGPALRQQDPLAPSEYQQLLQGLGPSITIQRAEKGPTGDEPPPSPPSSRRPANSAPVEGHESRSGWRDTGWARTTGVEFIDVSKKGGHGLALKLKVAPLASSPQNTEDKAAVILTLPRARRVANPSAILMDVLSHKPQNVMLAVGLEVGPDREYFEAKGVILEEGWSRRLKWDLNRTIWKSAATGWRFTAKIRPQEIHSIVILLYNPSDSLDLMVDGLTIGTSPPGAP